MKQAIPKFIRGLLSALVCDKNTVTPSFGKIFFWVILVVSIKHYQHFNEWWFGLLTMGLTYIFGNKYVPDFLSSKFKAVSEMMAPTPPISDSEESKL